jgi:hypothetical protein
VVVLVRTQRNGGDAPATSAAPHGRATIGVRLRLVDGAEDWRVEWSA